MWPVSNTSGLDPVMNKDTDDVNHEDLLANSETNGASETNGENVDVSHSVENDQKRSGDNPNKLNPGEISSEKFSKDYELSHPTDPDELPYTWYLQYLLRKENLPTGSETADRSPEEEHNVERQFDQKVLDYAHEGLRASGLDLESGSHPIETEYILVLLLKEVRKSTLSETENHLEEYDKIRESISIDNGYSSSTLSNHKNDLENQTVDSDNDVTYLHAIREAANRITYTIYRRGFLFPETVTENHEDDKPDSDKPDSPKGQEELIDSVEDGAIPRWLQDKALQNWAELFFQQGVFDQLRFGRHYSSSYPFYSFIGLLAHSAIQDTSISDGCRTCGGWIADYELVPETGDTIRSQITAMDVGEIETMFRNANQQLFNVVSDYGIFDSPHRVAFDPSEIVFEEDLLDDVWVKGHAESLKGNVEASDSDQIQFGLLGLIESDLRLLMGIYPIAKKSHNVNEAASLDHTLRPVVNESPMEVNQIVMDRQLVGAELIDHVRGLVGKNWLLHGKKANTPKELLEKTPVDEVRHYKNIDYFNELNNKPNLVVVPIPEEEQQTDDEQRLYLTDLSEDEFNRVNDGEVDSDYINFIYRNRRRIETTIGQVKPDFKIHTKNASTALEYYYINLSMIFFNIYNIINKSLSPEYGLPLGETENITPKQVLSALREVAFQKAREDGE
jgi:hypothetical protein